MPKSSHKNHSINPLKNPRKILITGASSGLGKALALEYSKNSDILFLTGRNEKNLAETAELCSKNGVKTIIQIIDVCDKAALKNWINEIGAEYGLDLVIANAGISAGTSKGGESAEQIEGIFAVNVNGVINTVQPSLQIMQKQNYGQIAIISSLAGFRGLPGSPAYSASKSAVRVYAEALRGAVASENIAINAVCPGYIKTPMTDTNNFPMPFLMTAEKAAKIIKSGLSKNRSRITFPKLFYFTVWLLTLISTSITDPLFARLPKK